MKAYVTTTGALFAVLVVLHLWRGMVEGSSMLKDPFYIATTAASAALAVWAWRLLSKTPKA
jgi:hypothetical protein